LRERERECVCLCVCTIAQQAPHEIPASDSESRRPCLSPIRASWFDNYSPL